MDYQKLYDDLNTGTILTCGEALIQYLQLQHPSQGLQKSINTCIQQINLFKQIQLDGLENSDSSLYHTLVDEILKKLQQIITEANGAPLTQKTRILFIASNPLDADPLQLGKEMEEIEEALQSTKDRDSFVFIKSANAEMIALTDDIGQYKPHIIHFAGHSSQTAIIIVNEDGLAQEMDATTLGHLISSFANYTPDLVYLNACFTARQAASLLPFAHKVLGFFYEADPDLANEFAKVFYKRIGNGHTIKEAFDSTVINFADQLPATENHVMLFEK